jgi:hypothetical protein
MAFLSGVHCLLPVCNVNLRPNTAGAVAAPYWGDSNRSLGARLIFFGAAAGMAGVSSLFLPETAGAVLG